MVQADCFLATRENIKDIFKKILIFWALLGQFSDSLIVYCQMDFSFWQEKVLSSYRKLFYVMYVTWYITTDNGVL